MNMCWVNNRMLFYFLLRCLPFGEADCLFLNGLNWCCSFCFNSHGGFVRAGHCRRYCWLVFPTAWGLFSVYPAFFSHSGDAHVWGIGIVFSFSKNKLLENFGPFFEKILWDASHNCTQHELRQQNWEPWVCISQEDLQNKDLDSDYRPYLLLILIFTPLKSP